MKQMSANRAFLLSLAMYLAAILVMAVLGYCFGGGNTSIVSPEEASNRLHEFHENALQNTRIILLHNLSVSLQLLALQLLPLFGLILASGNMGFSLGLLIKSVTVDSMLLPQLPMLMLILPHGIPEYLGFILMQNSVTNLYFAGFLRMFKIRVDVKRAGLLSGISLVSGFALVIIAAVIEGYATPVIAERLLHQL